MLEFSFNPGPQNADVLIFGDSSAFIGVDPKILQAKLGLKALLLPNTIGSLPITGDIPLQRYLATHAPPRLLVFYFSPWNLNYTHAKKVRFFEGQEMILRHGTAREIASVVWHYPTEFLFFPFRFYNAYGFGIVRSVFRPSHPAASLTSSLGHMDDTDPFPPLGTTCKLPTRLFTDRSADSVAELARKYVNKVPVLVYMAPVPECRNTETALNRSFSGLNAAPPARLAASDFVGDPYYAHIEPGAVPVASRLLAEAVQKRLLALSAQQASK